jgi:acetamidase/formamidase
MSQTYEFAPSTYYTTLGAHEPALVVRSGDTVVTTTVDNHGQDAADDQVTAGGNPQTGPFVVDGARPGDTLAVSFRSITPNRLVGRTSTRIAPHLLTPATIEKGLPNSGMLDWRIDPAAGHAARDVVGGSLAALRLPLAPFFGCFGVAPERGQTISSATSGTHGGNMDYRGFVAGSTVYFPVHAAGGLFFLGDGHACQADGEILGTGIEVSMDVSFTLTLLPGRTIDWPRAETEGHLMTVGNLRPLEEALQVATSEMLAWLGELGLRESDAHVLLGSGVHYDVGNVFDPAYTVVCRLPKAMLRQVGVAPSSYL